MIKNAHILEQLHVKLIKEEKLTFRQALQIFEAMWQEGVALGVLPLKDPLEGIDVDIKVARIVNCLKNF